ncbi:MAG: HAMP domain-containing sensor histidine kinase, partial [Pseudomonadota bacterium]
SVAAAEQLTSSVAALDSKLHEESLHVEALVEADQRKDEFMLLLAHELRAPLAPMQMAASLLSSGKSNEKVLRATSEVLARQVKHMSSLVDDLMDLSRFAKGNFLSLANTPVNLLEVMAASAEQTAPLIESRRHELVMALPDRPIFMMGDQMRLVQVVTNIVGNAAKYTNPGGRITLSLQRRGDEVLISIADNGVGMSAELLRRAFDLFSQGELSSGAQGGLGIGLSLVKTLVELHHGQVSATSAGPGLGSEFRLRFPLLEKVPSVRPATPAVPLTAHSA